MLCFGQCPDGFGHLFEHGTDHLVPSGTICDYPGLSGGGRGGNWEGGEEGEGRWSRIQDRVVRWNGEMRVAYFSFIGFCGFSNFGMEASQFGDWLIKQFLGF